MKIAKEEITNIQLLVDAICSKAIGSSDIDPNQVKLSLVSKNSREKAVQLTSTGARLRSELIMDYVYGRDKIFVEAVIQPSVVSYMK